MPIITKRVIAGNKNPSDFTISVTDNSPSPGSFAGSSSGTIVTLKAGSCKVSESPVPGYVASYSSGCSGSIGGGKTIKCNIRNEYKITSPGEITVVKNLINDDRGTKKPSDFMISITGNIPSPNNFHGSTS
ncbi:MAG: hypothetical protein WAZ77_21125 [Candidatus Nitrosopolaris sp.]|jgi:hypothetical protein